MNELDLLKRFRDDVPEPSTDAWLRAGAAIAAVRAETAESPVPSSHVRDRSPRHRRHLAALALGIALAAVSASLALMDQGPSTPIAHSGHSVRETVRPKPTVIRARVVEALSGENDTILFTQAVMEVPGRPNGNGESWDYPWSGQAGETVRQAGSDSVGTTVQNEWSLTFTVPAGGATTGASAAGATCNVSGQRIDVDFTNQTWEPSEQSCVAVSPGLEVPAGFLDPHSHQLTSSITTLVADGLLHVIGYPVVDGRPTVELKSSTQGVTTLDLWVDASTYLPVQSVTSGPTGDPEPGKTWTKVVHYSFLNPTEANLAKLQVDVPPGFKETVGAPGKD